jgi:hypothetical protein
LAVGLALGVGEADAEAEAEAEAEAAEIGSVPADGGGPDEAGTADGAATGRAPRPSGLDGSAMTTATPATASAATTASPR